MKFPWTKREDSERERRMDAEKRLSEIKDDWPRVHGAVDAVRHEADLDKFGNKAKNMFRGKHA